jgi:DNA recombination-dependent growth factor C|tara:strand:+ start:1619 stop:1753 length:135 start_codon:yes stop_codon:yes gene_type:complete
MEIKLNENQINQINKLLQSLPISHLEIVQEISAIMNQAIVDNKK